MDIQQELIKALEDNLKAVNLFAQIFELLNLTPKNNYLDMFNEINNIQQQNKLMREALEAIVNASYIQDNTKGYLDINPDEFDRVLNIVKITLQQLGDNNEN